MSKLKLPLIAIASLAGLLAILYGFNLLIGGASITDSSSILKTQEKTNTAFALEGQTLPSFTLHTLENELVESSSFADKPTFIMEWASWCSYCQEQMPHVQKVFEKYGDQVNFVMINATGFKGETPEAAKRYIAEKGYSFPWYLDKGLAATSVLKVESTPTIFVVDKTRTVKTVFASVQTQENLEKAIKAVLE